ncbi:hypothetical protein [Gorillibacterium sp. CAU 1737]|uniref:hypothetical protein n=1 Tax=Gorillibacterium sp. CAU 1737 TaxID=3140362 RepID=UPI0032612AB7
MLKKALIILSVLGLAIIVTSFKLFSSEKERNEILLTELLQTDFKNVSAIDVTFADGNVVRFHENDTKKIIDMLRRLKIKKMPSYTPSVGMMYFLTIKNSDFSQVVYPSNLQFGSDGYDANNDTVTLDNEIVSIGKKSIPNLLQ